MYRSERLGLASLVVTIIYFCRVVGGSMVEDTSNERLYTYPRPGQYKYIAHISSKAGFCTASILNKDWVLTAAHCLYFREKRIGDRDVRIIAGIVNYERPSRETSHETMSVKLEIHPDFWYMVPSKYDVALVKVRDSFEFGEFVGSIKVSGEEWPQNNFTMDCFTLGFGGFYSTAPTTTVLKRLDRTVTHSQHACPCAKRFQWKRIACVVEDGANLMCEGDDGGPLVCDEKIRGIAHMIWNRANCGGVSYPHTKCVGSPDKGLSVFMFLCPMNDWMHSVVSDVPPRPPSCRAPRAVHSFTFLLVILILDIILTY
uniref:Peptidase S1 domain-containing protein n=1 Tax=Cuerna arida TaxID=1464854 RepID=A0A1B6EV87_9HEMI